MTMDHRPPMIKSRVGSIFASLYKGLTLQKIRKKKAGHYPSGNGNRN